MYKWTDEDHELVQIFTAQGMTVEQISGLSVGSIKRSRAVNRGSSVNRISADNSQHAKPGASGTEVAQLRVQIAELKARLEALEMLTFTRASGAKPFVSFKLSKIVLLDEQQKAA